MATPSRRYRVSASVLDDYDILDTPAERAFDDIVQLACMVCDVPVAGVSFFEGDRQWFKARRGLAASELLRSNSVCELAVRRDAGVLVVHDILDDAETPMRPKDAEGRQLRFYAGLPLNNPEGVTLGALCVLDHMPRSLTEAQLAALEALARQTQYLLELRKFGRIQGELLLQRTQAAKRLESERADLQRRHDDLQREANHDPLTGLLNRGALERLRANPQSMQRLSAANYALAVIDIDHFKQINDQHGHLLGDKALRAVAQVMAGSIRGGDIAVRYGGEEFLLVLPATPLDSAFEVAERIRVAIEGEPLPFPVTVSIGVAAGMPGQDEPEQVFERADQALYRAKSGGRNRVMADDTPRV